MNIVIYGTGGVGGYFGARLVQAGNNVTFIARGNHLKSIQKNGLLLKSIKGDYLVKPASATANISEIYDVDLILICVKTWQLTQVSQMIKSSLNNKTMVISLLNGVENEKVLSSRICEKHILGGLCKVVSYIESPGIINHVSYEPTIVFGELHNVKTERALLLEQTFKKAGIKTMLANDIQKEIWTKFLFITSISGLGALTRASVGEMLESLFIKQMMVAISEEIVAIGKRLGINISENLIQKQFEIINSQPYATTSSLQRDMMQGKPSELEAQNGTIVKLGRELGIPTPMNDFVYYTLLPQEKQARKNL
jgi:2-dehydropantoate 2-reductase